MPLGTLLAALLLAHVGVAPATSVQAPQSQSARPATKLYVLTYSQGKAWIPGRAMQEQKLAGHAKYMRALLDSRVLVSAGPFTQQNGGMAIVRATDQSAADAILNQDPGVINGTFKAKASEWLPVFGGTEPLKK